MTASLASLLLLSACGGDNLGDKYVNFAKCLTEKGAVMYGAFWCPHCQNQKKMFGEKGFEQVKNVECDPRGENPDPATCEKQKIKGYPTWIFADGTRLSGEQSLEELSVRTSCELPSAGGSNTAEGSNK